VHGYSRDKSKVLTVRYKLSLVCVRVYDQTTEGEGWGCFWCPLTRSLLKRCHNRACAPAQSRACVLQLQQRRRVMMGNTPQAQGVAQKWQVMLFLALQNHTSAAYAAAVTAVSSSRHQVPRQAGRQTGTGAWGRVIIKAIRGVCSMTAGAACQHHLWRRQEQRVLVVFCL
jgi:hypothetical protein